MSNNVYIGMDFSIDKPAATIYSNGRYFFFCWGLKLTKPAMLKYRECGVYARSRNLKKVSHKDIKEKSASTIVLLHTIRSLDLAELIIEDFDDIIKNELNLNDDYNIYIATEGLSFNSKGDATLNLASYKGVMLAKIYEHYGDHLKRMYTYPPISLKSTAGCASMKNKSDKLAMIKAFAKEKIRHPFKDALLSGMLKAAKNYIACVDDLCDSYWALKTMFKKEELRDE